MEPRICVPLHLYDKRASRLRCPPWADILIKITLKNRECILKTSQKKSSKNHPKTSQNPAGGVPKSMPGEVLEAGRRRKVAGDGIFMVFQVPGGGPGEPRALLFRMPFVGFF